METEFTPAEGVASEGTPGFESTPDVATGDSASTDSPSYTVKIDGQEVPVTLDELLKGYQRQSDYTRKTQALAAERQQMQDLMQLAQALNTDPAGTIQVLQEAYGLTAAQAQQVMDDAADVDPEEQRWSKVEQFMAQQQERERQAMIDSEISNLKAQYGDFDEMELVRHAVENRIPNLRAAFADLRFSQLEQAKAEKLRQEAERVAGKRDAQIIEGGANTQRGVVAPGTGGKGGIRGAFQNSKRELGWS